MGRVGKVAVAQKAVQKAEKNTSKRSPDLSSKSPQSTRSSFSSHLSNGEAGGHELAQELEALCANLRKDIAVGALRSATTADFSDVVNTGSDQQLVIPEQKWFQFIVTFTIVVNAIVMGVETDYPDYEDLYKILELIFTTIFGLEMGIKLWTYRLKYFYVGWNNLDFVLVWMAIIDGVIFGMIMGGSGNLQSLSALRMLRCLRIVKMVRLLKAFRELWLIVKGMIDSVKTIFWASMLLLMLHYVFGIFICQMVGKRSDLYLQQIDAVDEGEEIDYHPTYDVFEHFGNVPRSMFTLFETSLEPLNIRPIVEKQPYMFPFFLMFIFCTTFGVMNVIIGVIVENTMEASRASQDEIAALEMIKRVEQVDKLRNAVFEMDFDKNGFLSYDEICDSLSNSKVAALLEDVALPIGTDPQEFFDLLNDKAKNEIQYDVCLKHLLRSVINEEHQDFLEFKISLHSLRCDMLSAMRGADASQERISSALRGLETEVSREISGKLGRIERLLGGGQVTDLGIGSLGNLPGPPSALQLTSSQHHNQGAKGVEDRVDNCDEFWSDAVQAKALPPLAGPSHSSLGGASGLSKRPPDLPLLPIGRDPPKMKTAAIGEDCVEEVIMMWDDSPRASPDSRLAGHSGDHPLTNREPPSSYRSYGDDSKMGKSGMLTPDQQSSNHSGHHQWAPPPAISRLLQQASPMDTLPMSVLQATPVSSPTDATIFEKYETT